MIQQYDIYTTIKLQQYANIYVLNCNIVTLMVYFTYAENRRESMA